MLYTLYQSLMILFRIIEVATLVYVVLSWIMPGSGAYYFLGRFLEPLARPFRRLNMKLTSRMRIPLDFSLWFMLIGLDIVRAIVQQIFYLLI